MRLLLVVYFIPNAENGTAFTVVGAGTGGIKPCVSAFGADQFDEKDPVERRQKQSFFNWFYCSINIGGALAHTVVVYVQVSLCVP